MYTHLQIQAVEIELDANSVVGLLHSNDVSLADYAPMVHDCRNLMNQIPKWKLNHCFRKANACVNMLAKMVIHL